jgi:hypothetical protein
MGERLFADWVAPIADRFRSTRAEIAKQARSVPDGAWGASSPNTGWSYHDVLAHLAEGDVSVQHTMRTVLEGGNTDFRGWNNGREDRIAAGLERGFGLAAEQLIDLVLAEGEETQQLFSRLGDGHESILVITSRTNPEPQSLRAFLEAYRHDEEHLEHLRPVVAGRPSLHDL